MEQRVGPAIRRVTSQASARRAPFTLIFVGAFLALAMALPLVYLLITVFQSLPAAVETIWSGRTLELIVRSIGLTVAVTATATMIALPVAWLTGRTDLPGRRIWLVIAVLPLVVPSYIGAYAFISAFGPSGLLQDILAGPFGVERLPSIIGFPGAWIVLSLFTYPLVLLPVRTAMSRLDPQLEDAASVTGRSPFKVFTSAILPQLAPAIAAGAVLVALYTLHDFGAVSIMRFDSFTREIYLNYRASFDRIGAASLSLLLVAIMLVLVWVEGRTRLKARHRSGPGATREPRVWKLGSWRYPAVGFLALVATFALVVPVAVLIYWATRSFAGSIEWGEIATAAGHSVLLSASAAVIAAACAVPIALLTIRFPSQFARWSDRLSHTGYALPGIVVALALVFFATRVLVDLYQTLLLLVFAFVVLFIPLAIGVVRTSVQQVSPRLEEAARTTGRSQFSALRTITAPLIAGGVISGVALVFLSAIKELPATLILSPIGFETLATEIWSATSVGFFERGAIPSLILLAVSAPSLYLILGRE